MLVRFKSKDLNDSNAFASAPVAWWSTRKATIVFHFTSCPSFAAGSWRFTGGWRKLPLRRMKNRVTLSSRSWIPLAKISRPWISAARALDMAADFPDASAATISAAFDVDETSWHSTPFKWVDRKMWHWPNAWIWERIRVTLLRSYKGRLLWSCELEMLGLSEPERDDWTSGAPRACPRRQWWTGKKISPQTRMSPVLLSRSISRSTVVNTEPLLEFSNGTTP